MKPYDVVVVGAGPAGATAARELRRGGVERVLLLERAAWPRLKPCAGGLSPSALGELATLGLQDELEPHTLRMETLRLVGPSGHETIFRSSVSALTMARIEFDRLLVDAAVRTGVEFRHRSPVRRLVAERGRVVGVETEAGRVRARWVVLATGATGRLVRPRPGGRVLETCMGWYEGVPFVPGRVEMLFTAELSPHYGWLFPESATRVNIGLCVDRRSRRGSLRSLFARFLAQQFAPRLRDARPVRAWQGHPIVAAATVGGPAFRPGTFVVGEAAGLVNGFTGEGISYALRSGRLAAHGLVGCDSESAEPQAHRAYLAALRRSTEWRLRAGDLLCRLGPLPMVLATRFGSSECAEWLTRGVFRPALTPNGTAGPFG